MPGLEPEVAGQPAAARVEDLDVHAGGDQRVAVMGVAEHGVLVAVLLDERCAGQLRWPPVGRMPGQHFAERVRLLREPAGVLVARQQVGEVRAEHGRAARFEHDDRGTDP
ncbi:hypothetical protein DEU38_11535 [Rhodococcus sp. AG1013]|uniref:hypothetical protein n=1 Tax=Rhodococcus sp. AG1013 TaxID=2183996 RepID=UPI000E2B2AA9|nr:hypothetical protein [Rhodococcus sp. AG1013]RDI21094.1 hypothetical protein DEU38_11535 [Rhodococcus sp. AG1013]